MYVCYVSGVCQFVFYAVGKSLPVCFSVVGVAASMLYSTVSVGIVFNDVAFNKVSSNRVAFNEVIHNDVASNKVVSSLAVSIDVTFNNFASNEVVSDNL